MDVLLERRVLTHAGEFDSAAPAQSRLARMLQLRSKVSRRVRIRQDAIGEAAVTPRRPQYAALRTQYRMIRSGRS
jgi:hypothetical protein